MWRRDYFNHTTTWRKNVYMGHKKYLPRHHPYRLQKKNFDGKQKHGNPPQPLSGEAIYFKLKEMIFSCEKKCSKNNNEGGNDYWKRISDFFKLPYWKNLHVRHCLDVMPIEKNVCMNIVGALLDISEKSKDGMNSRLDLVEMNIRPELTPMVIKLDALQEDIVMTLCNLEKYLPPSFFTIMVHLVVHLVREVKLCGPVYLRWMYPFERYMKVLKSFVRNRNNPEGCIAEAQVCEEAVQLCSNFLSGLDPIGLGSLNSRKDKQTDRLLSAETYVRPDMQQLKQAHLHILQNTEEVHPYIEEHMNHLKIENPRRAKNEQWLQVEHNRSFGAWIRDKVMCELHEGKVVSNTIRWLAHGPNCGVMTYGGYMVNGCSYHTKSRDDHRTVQNSGIMLVATTMQVSSANDKNSVIGDMSFYGIIEDIWEARFVVDPRSKKTIIQNSGVCFHQFKYRLTTTYVLQFLDDVEKLKFPLNEYSFIDQQHWTEFVASRLKEDFKKKSENGKEKRKKHKYNHRTYRKGYANLMEELKASSSDQIDRSIVWKQAIMDRKGQIPDEETKEVDELVTTQNTTNAFGEEDILTRALGGRDRPGILRSVGKIKELEEELLKMKEKDDCVGDLKEESDVEDVVELNEDIKDDKELEGVMLDKMKVETPCKLAFETKDHVVAWGTIIDLDVEGNNVKVAVDVVVEKNCQIHIPSEQVMYKMSQEVGSHILRPRDLVITNNIKMDYGEFTKDMSTFAPTPIQNALVALPFLLQMVEHMGSTIQITTPYDVFGVRRKCCIMIESLKDFTSMRPIATACLDAYIMYLYTHMESSRTLNLYKFVDAGNHWTLVVINLTKGAAFWIDPLKNRIDPNVTEVVERSSHLYAYLQCPKQSGVVECGYYVMQFMCDIIMSTMLEENTAAMFSILLQIPALHNPFSFNSVSLMCFVDHEVLLKCVVDHEVLLKSVVDKKVLLKCVVDVEVCM
ncbi:hypothetical protein E5676_scaffold218G00510 [Cucumis melo var. makuwa]|uniref:DUF4218 domain-containing protein n=1 Tax=Cucumis melo var. makuwa TaxID=1194695 RepID=A0A5D3BSX7_CUCMM|nr:hypothetical protein E5676_scaffold218G00510 [Cucumis melo var. makuwa]